MHEKGNLEAHIAVLQAEHRALDAQITETHHTNGNQLLMQRLKKRKLSLRDEIIRLSAMLQPDIIA